jgi:hypothetical protein
MKTAICLENLSYSYFSKELISEINKYVIESTDEICLVTFDETMPFANINTAVFTPSELDSFYDGVIISHKISHAMSILGCSNNSKKVLYLYDLDWMLEPMMFNDLYNVLTDENLILILRSEDHVSPIKNLCNREPDAIIKNFSLEKIWNSL